MAWATPTGAMLWEVWGRRKWNFAAQGAALLAALPCVWWIQHGVPEIGKAVLGMVLNCLFLGSCIDLVTCFSYIEVDARRVRVGFPSGLLLRPVCTRRLALVPMVFGGAALLALLALWHGLVARPLAASEMWNPLWLGAVALSFFWWVQALAWGLPVFPGRSIVLVLAGVAHLLAALIPRGPAGISGGWTWLILLAMLGSAVWAALNGLSWTRRGAWEGGSWLSLLGGGFRAECVRGKRRKFGSAFQAQLWLEWHKQGIVLPGFSCAVTLVALPLVFALQKRIEQAQPWSEFAMAYAGFNVLVPLAVSGALGTAMARFDPLQPAGEPPVYITVRPMTNGGFVLAKLVVAMVSSIVTWVAVAAICCFWLTLFAQGSPGKRLAAVAPNSPVVLLLGCLPAMLLLIVFTWKNLIRGMGAGLTGRRWVVMGYGVASGVCGMGFCALVMAAYFHPDFKQALFGWLPALVAAGLGLKILVAAAVFAWGRRRNVLTPGMVGWIAGGWLLCSLFMAGFAVLVCLGLRQPGDWVWAGPAGFLLVPLVDPAVAPLAMAWNRHR